MSKQTSVSFETVPLDTTRHVRATCLCLAAQRAARALSRRFDEAMRPVGLTSGQFSMLMALNRAAAPTMGAVAATLAMDRTTLTANLKPLAARGLVASVVDPADRRGRLLSLTEAGHAVLLAATPIWEHTHAEVERLLPHADDLRSGLAVLA